MNLRCPKCKGTKFSVKSLCYQTWYSDDDRWEDIDIQETLGELPYFCVECGEEYKDDSELEEIKNAQ